MSMYQAGNSAMPSIVGYGALGLGVLSAGSLLVGGQPVINVPGNEVVDFAASILAFIGGGAILKSRDPTAAWMGAGVIAMALTYAGMQIDTNQAGNMLSAAKNAATAGVSAASTTVTTHNSNPSTPRYVAVRPLKPAEIAECEAKADWTTTQAGIRNCTPATDGNRYVWKVQQ